MLIKNKGNDPFCDIRRNPMDVSRTHLRNVCYNWDKKKTHLNNEAAIADRKERAIDNYIYLSG